MTDRQRKFPDTFAVLRKEGAFWEPWVHELVLPMDEQRAGLLVHAVMFADGSIWDAYNGWRFDISGQITGFKSKTPDDLRKFWKTAEGKKIADAVSDRHMEQVP